MKTWREYFEYNNTENTQWCMPFHGEGDHQFDYLILFEGQAHSLYLDGKAIHDPSEDDLKKFAQAINPDYDLYDGLDGYLRSRLSHSWLDDLHDGWDDLHIALDAMRECGCSQCPFFGECFEMDNKAQGIDMYFIVDIKDGDMSTKFYFDKDEAIDAAISEWDHMSDADKSHRESFYVGYGRVEDDMIDDHDVVYEVL